MKNDSILPIGIDTHKDSVNTQKAAVSALVFLYDKVLQASLSVVGYTHPTKQPSLPILLSAAEAQLIRYLLTGHNKLVLALIYGSGLRVSDCLNLEVQDIEREGLSFRIINSKGAKQE